MEYDLVIQNGNVVDGTGSKKINADVGVKDGLIKTIGDINTSCNKIIDASDLIVCPGFIDIHTHFDPQLCWDGFATPSIEHELQATSSGDAAHA